MNTLKKTYSKPKQFTPVYRSVVLVSENANANYSTDFISRLYNEDGKGHFTAKTAVLGHIQQGGAPSPFDRNMGTKLATTAVEWMNGMLEQSECRSC